MNIEQYLPQIGAVIAAVILLAGRNVILPQTRQSKFVMWTAFAVTAICGLMLGYALVGVTRWVTGLGGGFGGTVASIGGIAAVWLGWHGVYQAIPMIRDLADGTPDGDARRAALWIPTLLPAGGQAVWGIVTAPRSVGSTVAAIAMAALTIVYAHLISKEAVKGRKARKAWHWFAVAVCLLAGVVAIPLVWFLDGIAADNLSTSWLVFVRVIAGTIPFALGVASVKDMVDGIPDQWVRRFAAFGTPLIVAYGFIAFQALVNGATNGGDILIGSMQ